MSTLERDKTDRGARQLKVSISDLSDFKAAGYSLFPLRKGTKVPRDKGWQKHDYSTFDHADWLQRGGNVGIRLKGDDLVLDIDPRNRGHVHFLQLCWDIDADLDDAPSTITGRGDDGRHYFFKKPRDMKIAGKLQDYPGIDAKTAGGYVVAPGSEHPESGQRYKFDFLGTDIADVTEAPAALLNLLQKPEPAEHNGVGGKITCEQLKVLLSALDPEEYGAGGKHHDKWLTLAMACHDATGGEGMVEWLEWCADDPQYGLEAWEQNQHRWESFKAGKPGGATIKTLLKAVADAGRPDLVASLPVEGAEQAFAEPIDKVAPAEHRVGGLSYQFASEIEQQNIRWLWPGRIARGKLSGLAGPPDQGKSQLTAAIAAVVTTGGAWPEGTRAEPGKVAMLSAEDDPSDTIAPRLEAAGCDMGEVLLLKMLVREKNGQRMFSLADDLKQLDGLIAQHPDIKLLTIDPISAYMGSSKNVDTFRNSDVRSVLSPLSDWAGKHGVAILFVTHFSKAGAGSAINRVMDSLAFTAIARSFWIVVPEQDELDGAETGRKLLLKGKQNIAKQGKGLAYRIEGAVLPNLVETSKVVWDGEVDLTGDQALSQFAKKSNSPKLAGAVSFLLKALEGGEDVAVTDLKVRADIEGVAWPTVRRAMKEMPVAVNRKATGWYWALEISTEG